MNPSATKAPNLHLPLLATRNAPRINREARSNFRRLLRTVRPQTPDELHGYITAVLGFDVPRDPMQRPGTEDTCAPFDYLMHSYFESLHPVRDCVVWANRGGGKTQLGAIATLLDLLFKPGIQIRILGGSFDQSSKMYAYLRELIERDEFRELIAGRSTGRTIQLVNGSSVEVLFQSERSVRGQRVQKLRCDEVDVFQSDVWQAAQFTTRSARCGDVFVNGCIEVFSTMHRPFGLMQQLVDEAEDDRRRLFKWSVLDVLERCPPARDCEECTLLPECQRRAKSSRGFFLIDDAVQQKARSSPDVWRSEMLCERPGRRDSVYPEFDETLHVVDCDPPAAHNDRAREEALVIGGMDFGYRSPTVMLWAWVDERSQRGGRADARDEFRKLCVFDEYAASALSIAEHIRAMRSRHPLRYPEPAWIGIDPAGYNHHESSGTSTAGRLAEAGFRLRARRMHIQAGIEAVRRRLRNADGRVSLVIHPRCVQLIDALRKYHYPPNALESIEPVKDGPDHFCDALRYMVINLDATRSGSTRVSNYT